MKVFTKTFLTLFLVILFIWIGDITYGAEVRGITKDSIRIGVSHCTNSSIIIIDGMH